MTTGVYIITNKINGKIYVGSSVKVEQRWREHESDLRLNKHHSKHLQRAYEKYGISAFDFKILEEVSDSQKLLEREQHYLDTLTPYQRDVGYNNCRNAHNTLGFKHTEESKKKMSESRKGQKRSEETKNRISEALKGKQKSEEVRRKIGDAHRGKKLSDETRRKMSEAHKGKEPWNKGVATSDETRKKISDAMKGRPSHWRGKTFSEEHRKKMSESRSGERNMNAVMDWEKVREMRRLYLEGATQRELASIFGVSRGCVQGVTANKTWYDENYDKTERK